MQVDARLTIQLKVLNEKIGVNSAVVAYCNNKVQEVEKKLYTRWAQSNKHNSWKCQKSKENGEVKRKSKVFTENKNIISSPFGMEYSRTDVNTMYNGFSFMFSARMRSSDSLHSPPPFPHPTPVPLCSPSTTLSCCPQLNLSVTLQPSHSHVKPCPQRKSQQIDQSVLKPCPQGQRGKMGNTQVMTLSSCRVD